MHRRELLGMFGVAGSGLLVASGGEASAAQHAGGDPRGVSQGVPGL